MPKNIVKITKGNRISVPNEFCRSFKIGVGDYLLIQWNDMTEKKGKKHIKPPVIMPATFSPKFPEWIE